MRFPAWHCFLSLPVPENDLLSRYAVLQIGVHAFQAVAADAVALGDIPHALARLTEAEQNARFGWLGGLLNATVKLRDGKKVTDMDAGLLEKLAFKALLGKIDGTDIEKLLKEHNVI